jgi:hypothetical protein
MGRRILICAVLSCSFLIQSGQDDPIDDVKSKKETLEGCSPLDHLKCVQITSREAFQEGQEGHISRHWGSMSYIGKACVDQHGSLFGWLYEGFFAIPHYTSLFFVNSAGLLAGLISKKKKRKEPVVTSSS